MSSTPPDSGTPTGALILQKPEAVAIAQALYNAVTGKTEKLTKAFSQSYIIHNEDIKQLHMKCTQLCNQWTVLKRNESLTVHHVDDNKETFSSFDRFLGYDISQTAPTEAVVYQLNILLTIPASPTPQNYKVTVRMISKVSMIKRMEEDMGPPPQFMRMFGGGSIVVEVEYVDYVIARSIIAMIDSWIKEVEVNNSWKWARYIQRYSYYIDDITYITSLIAATIAITTTLTLTANQSTNEVARWIVTSIAIIFIVGQIGRVLGIYIANQIDTVLEISAIKLNRGDDRTICDARRKNILSLIKGGAGTMAVTAQSIFCEDIVSKIIGWFKN